MDIAPWDAKEVVHIASKLIALCMGTFPTYHVKFPTNINLFSSPCCLFCFVFLLGWLYLVCFFNLFKISAAFVLPSRGALCLGDRVIMYLPRCADTNAEVRKVSAQVC